MRCGVGVPQMRSLLIVGAGGHGRSVLDCALALGEYGEIAFATNEDVPRGIPGFEILDERMLAPSEMARRFDAAVVAIGDNRARLRKVRALASAGVELPALVHPRAYVSPLATVRFGSVILAGSVVNSFALVGVGCILNTSSVVEHECIVADGVHLSPGAVVAGGCSVGEGAWLCANSGMADHVALPEWSTLAGGSFLTSKVEVPGLYAGSPATLRKKW